jgi:hypothetical protein
VDVEDNKAAVRGVEMADFGKSGVALRLPRALQDAPRICCFIGASQLRHTRSLRHLPRSCAFAAKDKRPNILLVID